MRKPATIFLAEDSPADVYLFREALKAHSVEADIRVFHDGESAMADIDRAEQDGERIPQIFVLDLNLPKVHGTALLKHLRASTRFGTAPVVILTGSNAPADRQEAALLGANCYISKPMDVDEFLRIGATIKRLLRAIPD